MSDMPAAVKAKGGETRWQRALRSLLYGKDVDRNVKAKARLGLAIVLFAGVYCVIGANAMVREGVTIATGCIIGAGALITRNTRPGGVYLAPASELLPGSSADLSALLEAR